MGEHGPIWHHSTGARSGWKGDKKGGGVVGSMWAPFWWLVRRGSVKSCNKQLESDNAGVGSCNPDRRSSHADFSFLVNQNISMTKKTHKKRMIGCVLLDFLMAWGWLMRRLVLLLAWGWMTRVCDLCGCCRFHPPILRQRYVLFMYGFLSWYVYES